MSAGVVLEVRTLHVTNPGIHAETVTERDLSRQSRTVSKTTWHALAVPDQKGQETLARKTKNNGVLVEIIDDDLVYAKRQDRYACAIVRAIERKMPGATRVSVNQDKIAFTLPDDTETGGTRYYFDTPADVVDHVIKPFDLGKAIDPAWMTFTLDTAYKARPKLRAKDAAGDRVRHRQYRARPGHTETKHIGRFMDAEAIK